MRSADYTKSPARRAIDICWKRCLPKNRYKYLQASEILGLIRELEEFLAVPSLLKPEEEALLRTTLKQKPQLRLFKGECSSFILGLVHFSTVEEFLETRFRIMPERLRTLVEIYEADFPQGNLRPKDNLKYEAVGSGSVWVDDETRNPTTYTPLYRPKSAEPKAQHPNRWESRPSESATSSSSSWFSKWRRGSPPEETYVPRYRDNYQDPLRYRNDRRDVPEKKESGPWLPRWMSDGVSWCQDSLKHVLSASTPLRESVPGRHTDPIRPRTFTDSVKLEDDPTQRKMNQLKESLADVRFHAKKLEEESRIPTGKSMSESLDELQAAVREQARLIARLERERDRESGPGRVRSRAPGVIAKMYVPWDYFTHAVTGFVRDVVAEVFPPGSKRSPPEFVVRVVSLLLGYFVIINFFKLVYFLVVLAMYSSESSLPYIFSNEEPRETAPISWLQEFPTLEYWGYQLREWTGK